MHNIGFDIPILLTSHAILIHAILITLLLLSNLFAHSDIYFLIVLNRDAITRCINLFRP